MPGADRTADHEPAAEGLDTVGEPAQAGAAALVGAADAVVDDLDLCAVVGAPDADPRFGGLRVLGHVGQRLAHDEVGRRLDGLGQALVERDIDRHGQWGDVRDGLDRRAQAVVGEHGGMQSARQLAQLLQRAAELVAGAVEHRAQRRIGGHPARRHAHGERGRHEPLLGAVVQVALQATALGVAGLDDAHRARRRAPRAPGRWRSPGPRGRRSRPPGTRPREGRARRGWR